MIENFKPISNIAPEGLYGTILCLIRKIVDFQYLTVLSDIKGPLKSTTGTLLDVGCGGSPYRQLLNPQCNYIGIDIKNNAYFVTGTSNNNEILSFDENGNIPLPNNYVDAILCTEVFEHVFNYEQLIQEIRRVLKPEGKLIVTIPWSARYHYIPNDYFRYTPSTLKIIFNKFRKVDIRPRGTDLTSICAKIIVLCARTITKNPFESKNWRSFFLPLAWPFTISIFFITVAIGHLSLKFYLGSADDPLGYTVFLEK